MLKIRINVSRQDVILSCSLGQQFPKVEGRLVSVEAGGRELQSFLARNSVPVLPNDGMVICWHGKHAGRAMTMMREMFDAEVALAR